MESSGFIVKSLYKYRLRISAKMLRHLWQLLKKIIKQGFVEPYRAPFLLKSVGFPSRRDLRLAIADYTVTQRSAEPEFKR
jgi:hypothetical protein